MSFREPPPQDPSISYQLQNWLYRLSQFVTTLTASSNSGGGGPVTSVSTTDIALTITPTTGAVAVSTHDFIGDFGSGGAHGEVPAPAAGDSAANKFLKADATWDIPAGTGTLTEVDGSAPISTTNPTGPVVTVSHDVSGVTAATYGDATHIAQVAINATGHVTSASNIAISSGTVTSVALSLPTELTVSGSPVTTSGTLSAVWASETQHFVFAAPSGSSGTPAFRALVAGDIPSLSYVTSVALSLPTELTVSGSPVTSSGTLSAVWASETAHFVFAAPVGGGTPSFRALVNADFPTSGVTAATYGDATHVAQVAVNAQGIVTSASNVAITATGTVTSVALSLPAELTVSGSPVTGSGTLTAVWANESANKVFAGPTTGGATTPAFRSLVAADIPSLPYGTGTVTSIATSAPITGGTITTTGTIGVSDFVASGASHARGTVPDPGASSGTTKFLCEDATFKIPPGTTAASTLQGQEFTTPGVNTFNVPSNVTAVWVTAIGAGGGGSTSILAATGGGGGGAGEQIQNTMVLVASGGSVTVTIGAKGTGGAAGQGSAQVGVAGGATSFGTAIVALGGLGGATTGNSGAGGGANGSAAKAVGAPGTAGTTGTAEAPCWFGGGSGGGGGSTTASAGGAGAGGGGHAAVAGGSSASTQAGGGSGASTIYGPAGQGGNGGAIGNSAAATSYGAGGGGGGGKATTTIGGGNGCDGYCLVVWVSS